MTDQTKTAATETDTGVIAKLRKARETAKGEDMLTLPVSGVVVTYPKHRAFSEWERAQRQADGSATAINLYYIIQVCRFDGERLRAEDYRELITDTDHMAISARIFGGKTGDAEGNA